MSFFAFSDSMVECQLSGLFPLGHPRYNIKRCLLIEDWAKGQLTVLTPEFLFR